MRLLFLIPEYVEDRGGGIITFYRNLLPLLVEAGNAVRVIVGSGVSAAERSCKRSIEGVAVENLELGRLRENLPLFGRFRPFPVLQRHLAAAWAMWEQAEGGRGYDVVEASDWGLLFAPWMIEEGPPAIVQLHGSIGQIGMHDPLRGEEAQGTLVRMLESSGIAKAAALQAYSNANGVFWKVQSGRDVELILPAWRRQVASGAAESRSARGLVVGRVQRWKGPDVLCQALRLLGESAPGIDWVGRDTSYEYRLKSTSGYLRETYPDVWGARVKHKLQEPPEATARLQAEAGFGVVPSLWDTFNFTCAEFMGAGTPTICSTGAGASELIEDGVNGFLFESGNAQSLAGALDRLLGMSAKQREELGEAGRQTVIRALDPVHIAGQRIAAYERAVRLGQQPGALAEDWLREACTPAGHGQDSLDFLDHLPLKALMGYVARRARTKLFG